MGISTGVANPPHFPPQRIGGRWFKAVLKRFLAALVVRCSANPLKALKARLSIFSSSGGYCLWLFKLIGCCYVKEMGLRPAFLVAGF
jgi:hypothetical protein